MSHFVGMLREVRHGRAEEELSDAVKTLTEQVVLHRKAGEITLKIKIKPNGANAVMIEDSVTLKSPVTEKESSIFFVDDDGNLTRRDPRQLSLDDLQEVNR